VRISRSCWRSDLSPCPPPLLGGGTQAKGCSAAQLAVAWVLARGPHVVPIPGTRRLSRLEENVGALELRLTPAEIAAIDQAIPAEAVVGERYPVRV